MDGLDGLMTTTARAGIEAAGKEAGEKAAVLAYLHESLHGALSYVQKRGSPAPNMPSDSWRPTCRSKRLLWSSSRGGPARSLEVVTCGPRPPVVRTS